MRTPAPLMELANVLALQLEPVYELMGDVPLPRRIVEESVVDPVPPFPADTEPERKLAPIEVVAIGAPLLSKAKMDEAAPLRRFQPIVVEATTLPLLSVPRMAEASAVKYVVPELVKSVVDACCAFS